MYLIVIVLADVTDITFMRGPKPKPPKPKLPLAFAGTVTILILSSDAQASVDARHIAAKQTTADIFLIIPLTSSLRLKAIGTTLSANPAEKAGEFFDNNAIELHTTPALRGLWRRAA
jgi:hypothetical protein